MSTWTNNNPSADRRQRWLSYWHLMMALVNRDIRARYRRTALGPLWAIIPAILATAIYSFLGGLVNVDSEGAPRLAFVFAATVPWTFFQSSVARIPYGVISNGNLLRKMPVPRQIFPFVVLLTNFFDFLMSTIVLVIALQLMGIPITGAWLWLPLLVLQLALLAWTVGIGVSAITIYKRDLLHGIGQIMQVWLFLTPVIYGSGELESKMQLLHTINPAVGIIDGFRRVFVFGQPPDTSLLLTSLLFIGLGLLVAFPLFNAMSRYFADVV